MRSYLPTRLNPIPSQSQGETPPMTKLRCPFYWACLGLWMLAISADLCADEPISFSRDILPILSDNCFHCHGPDEKTREADLSLHTEAGVLQGDNQVVIPNDSRASLLVQRILTEDPDERMPPPKSNRTLDSKQLHLIQRWVDEGAKWGKHWAYEVPQRPVVPNGVSALDYFIDEQLNEKNVTPNNEAGRETLIRRVTFDLTGLPPTLAEIDDYVNDASPDAYEKVVDRLLQSPRYGERMAWDWLDASRYADTNGFQGDPERTMWPWRDWVVNAFNANMPYDQFTIEQLAGDLLPEATIDQKLASGFNRNNMHNGEGGRIPDETRVENVFDRVETTATIWLGATFTCCRCHDHKFDPFTMRDYFGLYDIYNQMSETGQGRGGQAAPVLDYSTPEEQERVKKAQNRHAEVVKEVEAFELEKFPRPEGASLAESDAANLPGNLPATLARAKPKDRRLSAILEAIGYFETDGNDPEYVKVLKKLQTAERQRESAVNGITKVMIMDQMKELRDTFILNKGAYDKPTEVKVTGAMPASLVMRRDDAAIESRASRLDLAHWLVSPENPLTARVTVNRLWQMFFGAGLVKTVEDFGVQGERPSHPTLLDWMAVEFIERGWDVKLMCKMIVMSHAYRRSSTFTPELLERDPDNRLLARGPRYRLPSWMIRDAALAASHLLVDKHGGRSVMPYQPEGIWEEATFGKKTYTQDHGEALYRRTLYVFWRRIVGPTMLFDNAARQTCTVKTFRTNTPLHALTTLNDITYVEAARGLAQRVLLEESIDEARIETAFRATTSRRPTHREKEILAARLNQLKAHYFNDIEAAKKLLAVGESKFEVSLDVVELAAYSGLCSLLLNLDETITKE
jgi:Protein of unknown function (DUF1553)/Protein of unknown function (DUF1549)/Planctomycete cytochrome C